MNIIKRAKGFLGRIATLPGNVTKLQEAIGRIEQRQIEALKWGIEKSEFRVFSQWGEDGIIQYLINNIPIDRKIFVEFGVENYKESNTRFLALNNFWSGLVIDGSECNINFIKKDTIYWSCNLKAEHSFITCENINELISNNGIKGDIGILSVDIDGNDYWVWKAINCITPRIVITEYNSMFGHEAKITTPYDPLFVRTRAHFSKVYYGASIAALNDLAVEKGYSLVAGNAAGNNAFFVRNDLLSGLKVLTPSEAYRQACFREYTDEAGNLTYDDFETRLEKIKHLQVHDLGTSSILELGSALKG